MEVQLGLIASDIYSIDTNVFLDIWCPPEGNIYSKSRMPELWDHIEKLVGEGRIIATKEVYDELCNHASPDLKQWLDHHYIDGRLIQGIHEPIISEATYYRNKAILNGSLRNFSRSAEEEWPLRSGFLQHTCGKAMTGSSPRGRSGPSPRYSCMFCKAKELGISVSKMRGLVHSDFMDLMERVRPTEDAQKLFKHIVLREWNNETRDSHKLARTLDGELNALQDKRMRTLDLYIDNKISEADKDRKLAEVDNDITKIELRRAEITDDIKDKEQVIDNALLFMSNPASFWNLAPIEVKRRIQDAIFPDGLVYDCDKGFRTAKLAESYLLIQKIPANNAEIPCLVAATGVEPVTSGL